MNYLINYIILGQKFVNCSILITKGLERGVLMKAIEHKRIILPKMPTIDTEGRVGFMYNSAEGFPTLRINNQDFAMIDELDNWLYQNRNNFIYERIA